MKTLVCSYLRIRSPWMQIVIRYIGLRQYSVPNLEWHTGISGKEACNIMVAPRADDAFGNVGSLIVGEYIFDSDLSSIAREGF